MTGEATLTVGSVRHLTDSPSVRYVLGLCLPKTNPAGLFGVIAVGLIVLCCWSVDCVRSANCALSLSVDAVGFARYSVAVPTVENVRLSH